MVLIYENNKIGYLDILAFPYMWDAFTRIKL